MDFQNRKITGQWGGQPISRPKTAREKLLECANNDEDIKSLNFIADVLERKVEVRSPFKNKAEEDVEKEEVKKSKNKKYA